uniref:Uncharacterized protein n=1 Tax=Arundo donax TaxID=35708 RepID=A0A0A9B3U9_ARUDO
MGWIMDGICLGEQRKQSWYQHTPSSLLLPLLWIVAAVPSRPTTTYKRQCTMQAKEE